MLPRRLNQSLIKKVVDREGDCHGCPRYIFEVLIEGSYDFSSKPMLYGSYFEAGFLGSTVDGTNDIILPLAKGKPSAINKRLDVQIENAKRVAADFDINLEFIQTKMTLPFNDKWYFEGTCDIFPAVVDRELVILDTKMTQNLDANYGEYSWGDGTKNTSLCDLVDYMPSQYDDIQSQLYMQLSTHPDTVFTNEGVVLPFKTDKISFIYWVFEHSKLMRWRMFRTRITPQSTLELRIRLRKAIRTLEEYEQNGWKENPSKINCRVCPIPCKKRK